VTKHANQSPPGLALFVAQRTAQISEHQQLMRQAALSKRAAAHAPSSGTAGKAQLHGLSRLSFKTRSEAELGSGKTEKALRRAVQQAFTGPIDEPQLVFIIECEDRHVDFFHHRAQKPSGFEGAQTLFAERLA